VNPKIIFPALLILVLMGAAGWLVFRPKEHAVTVPAGARAGDVFLQPCTVKVDGVRYQADCGTLVVPEYRADLASRLIALPVRRIHSPAQSPAEPIFSLGGGPGSSNISARLKTWLLANHDSIQVGYRGVDGTPRLDCPEFAQAARGSGSDLLGPASLEAIGEAAGTCAARLQAAGVDLRGYTIPEVVEDMEAARLALGYGRIDLLSGSYGTRVAQIYAYMYPESLLRSAMIGVNPPGHFLWLPEVVDSQVEYYAGLCRQDPACSDRTPDLAVSMQRVNQDMPANWMGVPIDPGKVRMIAFALLYHRSTAPIIFDAYMTADEGDPSGLALMSLAYDFIMPNMMTWGEFLALGSSADYEPGRDYQSELNAPDRILGAPMSEFIWGSTPGHWSPILMPEAYRQVHPTEVETLLISGSIDFSTPAQFARDELLPWLRNGKQVVLAEQGHTDDFWHYQPEAAERLLTSFFDTGVADDSLYIYLPMDFKPALRFPLLAKALVAVSLLLAIGLAGAAWRVVHRLVRRRTVRQR
jgi:pimeloyl-ACP methyl ester carboxylesterase